MHHFLLAHALPNLISFAVGAYLFGKFGSKAEAEYEKAKSAEAKLRSKL